MRFVSIHSKLLVAISSLVILTSLLTSVMAIQRYGKSLLETAAAQTENLARMLAHEVTDEILIHDMVSLQKILDSENLSNPSVSYIFVVKEREILAHTFREGVPSGLLDANRLSDESRPRFQRIASTKGETYLDFSYPILAGKAGLLRIGFSEETSRLQISRLWLQVGLVTAIILIAALGIAFMLVRRVTGPLVRLSKAAESMSMGNPEPEIMPAGKDEVGRLTASFHQMVCRVHEYTRKLEEKNRQLDQAFQQTRGFLQIVQEIGAQPDLKGTCVFLIRRFREILPCGEMVFVIFRRDRDGVFIVSEDGTGYADMAATSSGVGFVKDTAKAGFVGKDALSHLSLPQGFKPAHRFAVFPVRHIDREIGMLLIACREDCGCGLKEREMIELILRHVSGALLRSAIHEEEIRVLRNRIEATVEFSGIIGRDVKMQELFRLVQDVAPTDATVLIQGESGTGKELVAQAIHRHSLRREKPFVVINCSAYPATLLESELFGHEKGAFTGAVRQKPGRFEMADGGTVFLDEIGEIPHPAQVKLLRVLQTQRFERLGGEKGIHVDVRIVAATNRNLLQAVKSGDFREDLYYRLNVICLELPPLRNRRNDILLLARHFLARFSGETGKSIHALSPEVLESLLEYSWPGNVRELENTIEHAVLMARGDRIETADLPPSIRQCDVRDKRKSLSENEKQMLLETLEQCNWNKKLAARVLGIGRSSLYSKIKKYRLIPPAS